MKMKDPNIAKTTFENISNLKERLDYTLWIDFVDKKKDYFIWIENTEEGKKTLSQASKLPESLKVEYLKGFNKRKAYAEFNSKKGYYEVIIQFNEKLGVISTTFQKKIERHHLELLLEMANHLDALLLVDGTKVINEETLKSLT